MYIFNVAGNVDEMSINMEFERVYIVGRISVWPYASWLSNVDK